MDLHPIDKPNGSYNDRELEEFMTFCILDRANTYKSVCDSFDSLKREGLVTRKSLRKARTSKIAKALRSAGYRFPNQAAKFLKEFGSNPIDLGKASRDELVDSVKGIGLKLASMYLRNTRKEQYAVIDVHVRNWLAERGFVSNDYKALEREFLKAAKRLHKSPTDLDLEIWESRRRKPKR